MFLFSTSKLYKQIGGFETPHSRASLKTKYLIPIDSYLQTLEEFSEVPKSLNFAQDYKDFPCTDQGVLFNSIKIGYKLN